MTTPEESPRRGSQEALDQMLGRDRRPYVVPRITDKGTILLLDDEQHEFHLLPKDAAELAIQILKAYCLTYGFAVEIPVPVSGSDRVIGALDLATLEVGQVGMIKASLTKTKRVAGTDGATWSVAYPVFGAIQAIVHRGIRTSLGIDS